MRKKSKNSSLISNVVILVAVVAVGAGVWFLSDIGGKDKGEVVAEVNGQPIYESEVQAQLDAISGARKAQFSALNEDSKFLLVREIAVQKLLLEQALQEGVDKNESVVEKVKNFEENAIREQKLVNVGKQAANDEALHAKYDEMVAALEGRQQVKVSHILVRTKKEAEKISRTLRNDKSKFEKIAMEESIDKKTAANGGSLNYLVTGSMVKEFEDAVLKMKVGEISSPVETKFGWHVIRLEDIGPAKAGTFEEAKALISQDVSARAIQEYVKSLTDSAEIVMLEDETEEEQIDVDLQDTDDSNVDVESEDSGENESEEASE